MTLLFYGFTKIDMKNLLFLLPIFWLGWTEKNAYIFMKSLKWEFNVFAASLFWWGKRFSDFKKIAEDMLVTNWDYWELKCFIERNKIDVVYMHLVSWKKNSQSLIDFLKRLNSKKIRIIETSPFSLYTPDTEKFLDYKLFVSKTSYLKFLWKFKKPTTTKYSYLYNNIDSDNLQKYRLNEKEKLREREKLWIKKSDFVVWKVWRADLRKRDDTIIDIVPILIKNIPNLKVVIRALPKYKFKKIKRLWIEKYFVLLPESVNEQDIANTYQVMDVMLHTSRMWESFWIALAEWMFYWLPVLTTDTDWSQRTAFDRDNSQWEILWNHNAEFISNDINYLANKIIELYKNNDFRKKVGYKNMEYAKNTYSVNILKNKLMRIINDTNIIDFNYDEELSLYKTRTIHTPFYTRLKLSIKAIYEYFKL